jgi:hypothetical protein
MRGIVPGPMAFGVSDRFGHFQLIAFPNQEMKMHLSTEELSTFNLYNPHKKIRLL